MSVSEAHSPEALALFNPAITSVALTFAVESYSEENSEGFPFYCSFLVMPLTLNPQLRASVTQSRRKTLASWCVSNPTLHAQFPQIARILVPTTRHAVRHSLRCELLEMRNGILYVRRRPKRVRRSHSQELRAVVAGARTCGKWFAATDVTTAFSLLGVRP
ncbi:three component ABC system middle component [Amycolatopsis granulosa]|uniref:three component ABC system middle component n=1 Tax=Amycolatopsis granulosa TaxID=185684 RepID=UPI003C7A969C